MQNAILKALEMKPKNRFKTCGEFAAELQVVARKEMLLAGPADLASLVSQLFPPSEVVTPARPGPAGF